MIDITNSTFQDQVLASDIPVLVDFYATWCQPCKTLTRLLESTAPAYDGKVKFVKVNIDDTELGQTYGVRGIPTMIMFKTGHPTAMLVGVHPTATITTFIDANT